MFAERSKITNLILPLSVFVASMNGYGSGLFCYSCSLSPMVMAGNQEQSIAKLLYVYAKHLRIAPGQNLDPMMAYVQ